jgi:predicted HAD superfamily Cof-like phosphohydrolase
LIEEEAKETVDAIRAGNLIEAVDGLMDLLVVTFGTIDEFGFDPTAFWNEVHRTNMAKAKGPVREDGKRLKPEGWQAPDIARLIKEIQ